MGAAREGGGGRSVTKLCSVLEVADVGCAECKLLQLLIREEGVRELVGVDIDTALLESHIPRLKPLTTDYVLPRKQPLTIHLMQGLLHCKAYCPHHVTLSHDTRFYS